MAELLGTVRRALRVLDHLADADGPQPIRALAADLGLNISSAYHVMNTLAVDGYVDRDEDGRFRLGPKAARLGEAYERTWPVVPALRRIVLELGEQLDENAYLALCHGRSVVVSEIVESRRRVRVAALHRGYSDNLHARALGKAVLAFRDPAEVAAYFTQVPPRALTARTRTSPEAIAGELARVRRRGYSEDIEEFAEGVCCLGAPFFAADGTPHGALSVSIPAFRYRAVRGAVRTAVLAAARAATAVLEPPRRARLG